MTVPVDLFWSFRSPYCYLALDRLAQLVRDYDVALAVRVVMPLAVRNPDYFESLPPARGAYNAMDARRTAAYLDVPFARPVPDPVVFETNRNRPAAAQPYIHRLSRLGALAADEGKGMAFITAVGRLLWDGSVQGWHEGDHLAQAVLAAGLDLASMDRRVAEAPGHYDALIAANEAALAEAGHWGVPTLAIDGEPFFGQDRLDVLAWRLGERGARR